MFDIETTQTIKNYMIAKKETIAVAESVTAGFLQAAIAAAQNASLFFQGGITVYNLGQKYRHLAVEPIHAQECDCVSKEVAAQMSMNVCNLFSAQWGIGITGYATSVPEGGNKLFAYWAIAHNKKIVLQGKVQSKQNPGLDTQLFYVQAVLKSLNNFCKKNKRKV